MTRTVNVHTVDLHRDLAGCLGMYEVSQLLKVSLKGISDTLGKSTRQRVENDVLNVAGELCGNLRAHGVSRDLKMDCV
jgi:hypothetical protein